MAIGELADYLRLAAPATRPALLLPAQPGNDLVNLITGHGIVLVTKRRHDRRTRRSCQEGQGWQSRSVAASHTTTH
jgi:hypothetical protein